MTEREMMQANLFLLDLPDPWRVWPSYLESNCGQETSPETSLPACSVPIEVAGKEYPVPLIGSEQFSCVV